MIGSRNLLILILFIFLTSFQTGGEQFTTLKNVAAFRKGIDQMAKTTSTIKAKFKQEKFMSILSNKLESEGAISFKKPKLLKWEYTKPYQYAITLNGKDIVINDQGKVKSFDIGSSQAFKQINELIINSVQGNVLDENKFAIQYLENKEVYLAKLSPKDAQMKKFLSGIDIYFDKKDYAVSRIKLTEPGKDYTLITFQDKKMNVAIPDDVFKGK